MKIILIYFTMVLLFTSGCTRKKLSILTYDLKKSEYDLTEADKTTSTRNLLN